MEPTQKTQTRLSSPASRIQTAMPASLVSTFTEVPAKGSAVAIAVNRLATSPIGMLIWMLLLSHRGREVPAKNQHLGLTLTR